MEANKKRGKHIITWENSSKIIIYWGKIDEYVSEYSIIYLRLLVNGLPSSIVNIGDGVYGMGMNTSQSLLGVWTFHTVTDQ